jgi:broad specificity phosphatase PhoE
MSLTLYFLRHGETIYSQSGGFCGDLDPELTPEGAEMAIAFANAYHDLPWTAIYASPMRRTIATAQPLCNAVGLEMITHPGLREIRYGDWENQTAEAVKQHDFETYQRWMTEPAWNSPPNGETAVDVASRSNLVISAIEEQYSEGHILVVSHKATIRIILCSLLGIDLGRYRDRLDIPAASLSVVQFEKYGPRLVRLGDRSFLPAALQSRPGT